MLIHGSAFTTQARLPKGPRPDSTEGPSNTSDEYVWAPRPHAGPEPGTKLLNLVDTRQSTSYSCGAGAMQSVMMYYGEEYMESELMAEMGTSPDHGTTPNAMANFAREAGYNVDVREGLTLGDLEKAVEDNIPVTVAIQAWRATSLEEQPWKDRWDDGHYVVVMGLDKNNVYVEDPSLLGSRGVIPRAEFEQRWHDVESDGRKYFALGLYITSDDDKTPTAPAQWLHVD